MTDIRDAIEAMGAPPASEPPEVTAERRRRLKQLARGRHPDTGAPLTRQSVATLRPMERCTGEAYLLMKEEMRLTAILEPQRRAWEQESLLEEVAREAQERRGSTMVAELGRRFAGDSNPVHAWLALAITIDAGMEIPDWVVDYLLNRATEMSNLVDAVAEGRSPGREPEQVGKAMGFRSERGASGYFAKAKRYDDEYRDEEIAAEVRKHGGKLAGPGGAWAAVASKRGIKAAAVRAACERADKMRK